MNRVKRLLPLLLAILFAFAFLCSACAAQQNPVDPGTSDGSGSGKNSGGSKESGVDTESGAYGRKLWPSLNNRQVLTITFNEGKTQTFTGNELDDMAHTTASVWDRESGKDKNGSKVSYQGVSLKTVLSAIGLEADKAKKLILVDANGRETDLTAELANISISSCTFALAINGTVLPDEELGCFVIIYKDGTRNVEHRGIVEIRFEF
ncbi:MAG: hypothetical protein IJM20_03455 [Clostridia bacterium]|nr:hypothetical protein [Clostridia bacterium]